MHTHSDYTDHLVEVVEWMVANNSTRLRGLHTCAHYSLFNAHWIRFGSSSRASRHYTHQATAHSIHFESIHFWRWFEWSLVEFGCVLIRINAMLEPDGGVVVWETPWIQLERFCVWTHTHPIHIYKINPIRFKPKATSMHIQCGQALIRRAVFLGTTTRAMSYVCFHSLLNLPIEINELAQWYME